MPRILRHFVSNSAPFLGGGVIFKNHAPLGQLRQLAEKWSRGTFWGSGQPSWSQLGAQLSSAGVPAGELASSAGGPASSNQPDLRQNQLILGAGSSAGGGLKHFWRLEAGKSGVFFGGNSRANAKSKHNRIQVQLTISN